MRRRPQKNVDLVMADVRHPQGKRKKTLPRKKISRQNVIWGSAIIFLTLVVALFVLDLGGDIRSVYRKFRDFASGVQRFDGADYFSILDSLESDLVNLDKKAQFLSALPKLRAIPEIIDGLGDIVATVKALGGELEELGGSGFSLAFKGEGERLIGLLRGMEEKLGHLREVSEGLLARAKEFGVEGEGLDLLSEDLIGAEDGLRVVAGFLDSGSPRRLVLLFENPSELRPNGGFAGSYGELVLERGSVKSLEVNDIYYPDKFLPLKVVPPLQLQTVTPNWGARDTGWFFDFSKSARNLLDYLEASEIYSRDGIKFDGVIGINVRVIEDLLRVTGPIEVPEYGLTLDHRNFLSELQREVEANKVPGENPKAVLSFAAPKLMEALGNTEGGSSLLNIFVSRARNKDIQIFFRDPVMQSFISDVGVDGRPYEEDFTGDYLAVVNSNVAGGKTDIFVDQAVVLKSELLGDGRLQNTLTVTRHHKGGSESDPWYNHVNQNFLKAFTPSTSVFGRAKGGKSKEITPKLNYIFSGYEADPDIEEVEGTRVLLQDSPEGYAEGYLESGKRVFATWFNVDPGERESLEFTYSSSKIPLGSGQKFKFVLDKQSGSEMHFEYAIVAPDGYRWAESRNDLFRYRTDSVPARLELQLTLVKSN